MSLDKFDVVVIGGGMSGVHAAYPIVKAGYKVALVDGGLVSAIPPEDWYHDNFENIRKKRYDQDTLFLGKDFSGISVTSKNHAMSMTSGSRAFITQHTKEMLPLQSPDAAILQSLAKGGLGEAWGAVCEIFDDEELKQVGLSASEIKKSYQDIINIIGVSGKRKGFSLQPPVSPDMHTKDILQRYKEIKKNFENTSIVVSQSALACLTRRLGKRNPTSYNDMDFWSNKGKAIYRPSTTIDELAKKKNFIYIPGIVVSHMRESKENVDVVGKTIQTNKDIVVKGKRVIVAAGALNSTRILLKSFSLFNEKVPFIYKQNILIPSLHFAKIDPYSSKEQVSFCQVVMMNNKKIQGLSKFYAQMYTYKSLLLHKLLPYIPLPVKEGMTVLSLLTPYIMLVDIRFPNNIYSQAYIELQKRHSREQLFIYPVLAKEMKSNMFEEIKNVKKNLLSLKLLPLKTVFPEKGATAHYAGGIPFANERTAHYPLTVDQQGKLNQAKRIYVADPSTWLALPAKPHSLTLMAQANIVGKNVLKDLFSNVD